MKRIAVWNTAFLGDAVLTLPLIQSLKEAWPDATIDFYVRGGLAPLFEAHPALNAVYSFSKKSSSAKWAQMGALQQDLRQRAYDLLVCAHPSPRSGLIARMSHAPVRVGYSEVPGSLLWFNRRISRSFTQLEEVERLLELLKPLGVPSANTWPEIHLPASAHKAAHEFISSITAQFGSVPVVGLHPGSVWPTKRWPTRYFAALGAQSLAAGAAVVVFAGPGEEAVAAEVLAGLRQNTPAESHSRIYDLSGALPLVDLAAYIGKLSCYITNDSGPMHLAWAQHVPVAALFGPTVKSLGFFPRGQASAVSELALECRPCGLHGHTRCPKGHHDCMEKLLPGKVWPHIAGNMKPV